MSLLAEAPDAMAEPPDRTAGLTAEIAKAPNNPELYIKRARIYIERGENEPALADLEQAAELPGGLVPAVQVHAPLLLRLNRPREALERLTKARAGAPADVGLLVMEARTLEALGRRRDAVESYRKVLATQKSPPLEHYFELGRLLTTLGDKKSKRAALEVYDQGIRAIGPVVSLIDPAVALEVELRRWDQALAHLELLAPQMTGRRDLLLSRKAEILRTAGRTRDAKQTEAAARQEWEKLPAHIRASTPQPSVTEPKSSRVRSLRSRPTGSINPHPSSGTSARR